MFKFMKNTLRTFFPLFLLFPFLIPANLQNSHRGHIRYISSDASLRNHPYQFQWCAYIEDGGEILLLWYF